MRINFTGDKMMAKTDREPNIDSAGSFSSQLLPATKTNAPSTNSRTNLVLEVFISIPHGSGQSQY